MALPAESPRDNVPDTTTSSPNREKFRNLLVPYLYRFLLPQGLSSTNLLLNQSPEEDRY